MNDTFHPSQSSKMFTRNPIITALFAIPSEDALWCVSALEDGEEPARVWAMNETHANEIAKVLESNGFTDIEVEEV